MLLKTVLSVLSSLSGFIFVLAFLPYIFAILRGETKPSKVSWFIWATLDVITLSAMYVEKSVNGQILGAVGGAFIILSLALRHGKPGWTKVDKFCLLGAILGLLLWKMTSNPNVGILVSALTAITGSIPTFVNAWNRPQEENLFAWSIFWYSCLLALTAIPKWSIADAAQPITFTIIESTMMFILLYRRPRLQKVE